MINEIKKTAEKRGLKSDDLDIYNLENGFYIMRILNKAEKGSKFREILRSFTINPNLYSHRKEENALRKLDLEIRGYLDGKK